MKDTFNALVKRGISEDNANLLLTKYNTLKSIYEAGPSGLTDLGIGEEEASDIISSIGKSSPKSTTKTKTAKKDTVESVVVEPMEPVVKFDEPSEDVKELLDLCKELGLVRKKGENYGENKEIPLQVICDIAGRIKGKEVSDEKKRELLLTASRMCVAHRTSMNEPVGIVAAQSLGEPGTQMNMRTFHYAGVANINVTQGLPRLIEIVEAREASTPTMVIPLQPYKSKITGNMESPDDGIARGISYMIEETILNNVANVTTDITHMQLIIEPDSNMMDDRNINIDMIVDKLSSIRALSNRVEKEDNHIIVSCKDETFQKLQEIYEIVKVARIRGIPKIKRAVLSQEKDGTWVIITEGSNLKEVIELSNSMDEKAINIAEMKTNDILETASVLGIEAARRLIIQEAHSTLSEAGLEVDIRHIMLVADMMTNTGFVRPLNYYGIVVEKTSPISRAAFERIGEFIEESAFMGLEDRLGGVVENIIIGQPITLGTGAVNLIYKPVKGDKEE